jgi:Cys-tRNA(Pro) deacylase
MLTAEPLHRVCEAVKSFDESLEPIIYDEPLKTTEEAARALRVEIGQIAKSLLFRSDDNYGLFVAAGDVRVNQKKVKKLLGGKKAKMASPEEVEQITGFKVGAVCPFGLLQQVPIFIDESLQRFNIVYTAAGIPESLLPVSYEKLLEITKGTVINVAAED